MLAGQCDIIVIYHKDDIVYHHYHDEIISYTYLKPQ